MADSSMSRRKQDAGLRGFPLELHEGQTVLRQLLLVLNIRRQILVAAASSGSAGPKASIVSEPSYWMVLSAANVSFQFTAPFPGVLRSFSETCTWIRTSAQPDSASVMSFSSMLAWKVSYIMRKLA